MNQSKISVQIGESSFSAEGAEAWVQTQLEFFLSKLPDLSRAPAGTKRDTPGTAAVDSTAEIGSLASYIRSKSGESNQTQRFLATADWLRLKGEKNLNSSLVAKALRDNQQSRLGNPADALNKNVAKGYCEKTSDGFFITPEGRRALGHQE